MYRYNVKFIAYCVILLLWDTVIDASLIAAVLRGKFLQPLRCHEVMSAESTAALIYATNDSTREETGVFHWSEPVRHRVCIIAVD